MPEENRDENRQSQASSRGTDNLSEQVGLRVSLIPAEEMERRDPRQGFKRFLIAVSAVGAIIAVGVGYLGFRAYFGRQEVVKLTAIVNDYDAQSSALSSSLAEAKLVQTRLRSLSSLLDSHRNAAPIFDFLERHTLPDVAYSSVAISETGGVNLSASAASFESYAAQISELRSQPEVKSLVSSGLSPAYGDTKNGNALESVNFALSIGFDPSIFVVKQGN